MATRTYSEKKIYFNYNNELDGLSSGVQKLDNEYIMIRKKKNLGYGKLILQQNNLIKSLKEDVNSLR